MIRHITIRRTRGAHGRLLPSAPCSNSGVSAKPIAAWEAANKGGALGVVSIPWSIYIAALTVDAAFITYGKPIHRTGKATEDKIP